MKKNVFNTGFITHTLMTATLTANPAFAALNLKTTTAQSIIAHESPSGKIENCYISNKLIPEPYNQKTLDEEKELCALDFYTNVGTCPKQNSTNPGILITEIKPGQTRKDVQLACQKGSDFSVSAKFKNSISCSYTPSILAYYHFSKLFDMARVPTAVLRTMDKEQHRAIVKQAPTLIPELKGQLIYQNWLNFEKQHNLGTSDNLFDSSRQYVYGALVENPKKEIKYTELNTSPSYQVRYENFIKKQAYKNLTDSRTVSEIAGTSTTAANIQTAVQMKDIADMIVLDTLLNQQDRIGNIHYKFVWYELVKNADGTQKIIKTKSKATIVNKAISIPANEKVLQAKGAFLIKEMLLKDNDCGVAKSNEMKRVKALESLAHISRTAYTNILNFHKVAKSKAVTQWMQNELLMTPSDIGTVANANGFLNNLDYVIKVLKMKCETGKLRLDLDMQDILSKRKQTSSDCTP